MIKLKNFTQLNQQNLKLIYEWRNDKNISKFMKNKNFSFAQHIEFVKSLKNNLNKKYFLVFKDDEAIGVIDFINITLNSCEFGLYAKPNLKGVGQILMDKIKKHAFEKMKIKTRKACVFKENEKALNLYLKNGFNIIKKDENMLYLELKNGGYKLNSLFYLRIAE